MTIALKAPPPTGQPEYVFTLEQYHRMIDANIITEEDRVEFIEGVLVPKMTKKPPHESTSDRLEDALRDLLPKHLRLRVQKVTALANGEPEPDVSVVLGPKNRYDNHHPTPEEILLVGEVSESSLGIDRGKKYRSYAAAGIPVYWIVNLIDRQVEVYTSPKSPRKGTPFYSSRIDYKPGQDFPVVIEGATLGSISVDVLLPPG